jgi:DNA-binding NtrC family response regulator
MKKKAKVRSIRTQRDRRGTHDDYTLILAAGEKGTGKEIIRVHVWGDSPKSEEHAVNVICEAGKDYVIIW